MTLQSRVSSQQRSPNVTVNSGSGSVVSGKKQSAVDDELWMYNHVRTVDLYTIHCRVALLGWRSYCICVFLCSSVDAAITHNL